MMNDYAQHIEAIQQIYPDFEITSVSPNETGQYNTVLVVNDAYIFRFPKYEPGLAQLALETKILTAVQPAITLNIPRPMFQNFDTAVVGDAFMGYQRIVGEPFWRDTFLAIKDERIVARLAAQLAQFLRELHQVPIQALVDEAVPVCDTQAEWEDVYGRVQTKLFPYMRLDACQAVAAHFENYFNGAGFAYEPCLRHGDFGTGNILYDTQMQHITGVIDFGFTTLGDPAFDFAGLLQYGESFVRQMTDTYPELDTYWPRIWFYKGTFALFDALFGIENGDQETFEQGIADYI